jgi:hypothetical protein
MAFTCHPPLPVSFDLQALIVDGRGEIRGAVHDRNLVAGHGHLRRVRQFIPPPEKLSDGTENVNPEPGYEQDIIWMNLARFPSRLELLVFVLSCHDEFQHLADAENAKVHLFEEGKEIGKEDILQFPLEGLVVDATVLLLLKRDLLAETPRWNALRVDGLPKRGRRSTSLSGH